VTTSIKQQLVLGDLNFNGCLKILDFKVSILFIEDLLQHGTVGDILIFSLPCPPQYELIPLLGV
jgi:hypothetical protein